MITIQPAIAPKQKVKNCKSIPIFANYRSFSDREKRLCLFTRRYKTYPVVIQHSNGQASTCFTGKSSTVNFLECTTRDMLAASFFKGNDTGDM